MFWGKAVKGANFQSFTAFVDLVISVFIDYSLNILQRDCQPIFSTDFAGFFGKCNIIVKKDFLLGQYDVIIGNVI